LDPSLGSPFLQPGYTQAIAAARDDVEVAILGQDGEPVGFFPFQRTARNVGKPVGTRLTDLQGAVIHPDVSWDPGQVLRASGLKAWDFNRLSGDQQAFIPFMWELADGVYMDLSCGFEAYVQARRDAGSEKLKQLRKFARRATRDHGPLHFVPHEENASILRQLLEWKSAQYRKRGVVDVVSLPWVVQVIEQIAAGGDAAFRGMLSALYFGDRLVALELGLRSHDVLAGWFAAYDPEFAYYSPGMLLTVELAQQAPSLGLTRLDLGKNNAAYKEAFATHRYPLASGSAAVQPLTRLSRSLSFTARRWSRLPWVEPCTRFARRLLRPVRDLLDLR
jgi:CelD/BcsL family acetyltransferase involved in cellulose biosynthesis